MKHIVNLIIIFTLACLSMACQSKETKVPKTNKSLLIDGNTINIYNKNFITDADQFIDSITYIPLETTQKSLIGKIERLEIINDNLIIYDKKSSHIYVFDFSGRFIRKIGEKGKGPNEYMNIRCFSIDHAENNIIIYDDVKHIILSYNLNGELIEKEKFWIYPSSFCSFKDNLYFYQAKSRFVEEKEIYYDLIVWNNGKIEDKYFKFKKDFDIWFSPRYPFYLLENQLCIIRKWENKIYVLEKDKPIIKYNLNFGNNLPLDYSKNADTYDKYQANYAYLWDYFVESEDQIYIRYIKDNKLCKFIYFKDESGYLSSGTKPTDLFELYTFDPIYAYRNMFICLIEPRDIINAKKFNSKRNKFIIKNIEDSIKMNDNPIVAIYQLKESLNI